MAFDRNDTEAAEALTELVLRVTSNEATDSQQEELDRLVLTDEYARAFVIELLEQIGIALWQSSPPVAEMITERPNHRGMLSPALTNLREGLPWLAMGALSTAVVGLIFIFAVQPRLTATKTLDSGVFAPELVAMTACVWQSSQGQCQPQVGHSMERGEVLHLLEGIAELELERQNSSRARVRIEGPASVFARSDGMLGLNYGVLTADVEAGDQGFVINTPAVRVVVDPRSSVGLVAIADQNEVHVFRGRVNLQSLSSSVGKITALSGGEAAALNKGPFDQPSITLFEASASRFASSRSMAFDKLHVGPRYREAVLRSKPALYCGFDDSRKEVVGHEAIEFREMGGVTWRKFGDNIAAEFGLTKASGCLVGGTKWPAKPLQSYSVELWAKPSHFHNGALISLVSDEQDLEKGVLKHALLIEIGGALDLDSELAPPFGFRLVHRSPPSTVRLEGTSCVTREPYAVRSWQHIVARKDDDKVQLLINGQVVSEGTDATPLPSGLSVVMGQLYPAKTERPFIGQIDEVALYERALTDEEIREHIKVANGQASDAAVQGS